MLANGCKSSHIIIPNKKAKAVYGCSNYYNALQVMLYLANSAFM